jgi:hypothetical protein
LRFYILYPERSTPGGGHKQMRLLARNLRQLGEESYLLQAPGANDDNHLYDVDVPWAPFRSDEGNNFLSADDVLLLPEIWLERNLAATSTWKCRRAVYAQGGFLALLFRPPGGYAARGIEFMLGVSPYIVALGQRYLGLSPNRTFHVPYPVFRGPFATPSPSQQSKQLAVSFMPRKLPEHIEWVRALVHKRMPDVPWVPIDGLSEREVAQRLSETAVFFSTQNCEGFGLPAIEAMSRASIVCGYRGTGLFPHPYASPQNGLWARDRSVRHGAERVINAIELARFAGPARERLLAAARETAAAFTEERALEALGIALQCIRTACYPRPTRQVQGLGILGHMQALRTLQHARTMRRGQDWEVPAGVLPNGRVR